MRQLFYAACFFEAGLLLIILPWTVLWDHNYLFDFWPAVHAAAQSGCAPGWPCRRFLGTATADFTEFGANPGGAKTGLDVAVAQQFFNIKRFFSLYCIQSGHSRSSRVDSHLLRW